MQLLKPKISIPDIEISIDEDRDTTVNDFLGGIGMNLPIIQIGDQVLGFGDLMRFELKSVINDLPFFSMEINDEDYIYREKLKNDIDKCIIWLGFADWNIKFEAIIDKIITEAGDATIECIGQLWNEKLYESKQKSYTNKTITDILTDVCKDTQMGLFTYPNSDLNITPEYELNPNNKNLKFFTDVISRHTKNIFFVDYWYNFHVSNIETLRKQPVDKYTMHWQTGENIGEQDIILKSKNVDSEMQEKFGKEENDFRIPIQFYSIDTNYSGSHKKSASKYYVNTTEISTNEGSGIGEKSTNTFSAFVENKSAFYREIVNRNMMGNVYKINLENPVLEILPMFIVELILYLPFSRNIDRVERLDTEHSGKKIVISNHLVYNKPDKKDDNLLNNIKQYLELI
jgi:hypothetical protein